jgi:nucleotide-binding universal stress UspA family protein
MATRQLGTILCGVDIGDATDSAVHLARALQARLGMRLILLHVLDGNEAGARAALAMQAERLDSDVDMRVEAGPAAEAIARVAGEEGADLIVIGARDGRRHTIRCGLARELQTATPVPVLVVPPSTRRPTGARLGLGLRAQAQ